MDDTGTTCLVPYFQVKSSTRSSNVLQVRLDYMTGYQDGSPSNVRQAKCVIICKNTLFEIDLFVATMWPVDGNRLWEISSFRITYGKVGYCARFWPGPPFTNMD